MRRTGAVLRRTAVAFYDDQMTHHAAALTYYGLMSLFPALLLGVSLLVLIGEADTYDSVLRYLSDVVPVDVLRAIDDTLEAARAAEGTAVTTLIVSIAVFLYGATGVLEATRRALNVVWEIEQGRKFWRRKAIDITSALALIALALAALTLVFVGRRLVDELLGNDAGAIWAVGRWPAALLITVFLFSAIYYVTPDVHHRSFRWITPGAAIGVVLWLGVSWAFGRYISSVADVAALYGAVASAIVLIGWLWLTMVCLLFGAELDAEIERAKELAEGVPPAATLALPEKAPG